MYEISRKLVELENIIRWRRFEHFLRLIQKNIRKGRKMIEIKSFNYIEISPVYQSIRMFDNNQRSLCAPDTLLFESFLPWIWKIMLAYQDQEDPENEQIAPEGIRYSKAYYTKKFR